MKTIEVRGTIYRWMPSHQRGAATTSINKGVRTPVEAPAVLVNAKRGARLVQAQLQ